MFSINEKNLFEALIYPMSRKDFFDRVFAKKALVIKGGSSKRFDNIVKTQMFDLDLKKMSKHTASDKIHIWFPLR